MPMNYAWCTGRVCDGKLHNYDWNVLNILNFVALSVDITPLKLYFLQKMWNISQEFIIGGIP